jgi:glycosyltransferase involved in cell wall biosynthesis
MSVSKNRMKPLITVAIPTCNRSAYLRETLESVLRQDYENLEILVSDNASEDNTAAVVTEMSREHRSVRYRRNLLQAPLVAHFNQCLAEARGEFFVLLSDDDRISENFISSLAEGLISNRRATVAVPANVVIDESGLILKSLPPPGTDVHEGIDFVIDWLWKRIDLPVANFVTIMGRTETMRKLRYEPFPSGINSDNLLFLQLALTGQVVFCRNATFFWRVHKNQAANRSSLRSIVLAGRQFQRFVHKDWALRRLVRSYHPDQQRLIRRGVRRMVAEAYLHNIGFFDRPWAWQTLRQLLAHRPNRPFVRLVLHHYLHLMRQNRCGRALFPAKI